METEKQIQNEILREFGTKPEYRLWRQNVGKAVPFSFLHGIRAELLKGNFTKALALIESPPVISFGQRGQADLSGIYSDGRRLEIEVKAPGGTQSKEQKVFERTIKRFGGIYILAKSVTDVTEGLANE